MHIKEDSLIQLKDLIVIDQVINRCGVELKKRGSSFIGLCPFHNEKSPSFHVTPQKGIYKCFGCGKAGDAIGFVMEHDKMEFIEAVKKIADIYRFRLEYTSANENEDKEALSEKEQFKLINRAAAHHWQKLLMGLMETESEYTGPALLAKEYLLNIRQMSMDTIVQFGLGFAPDAWKYLSPMIVEKGMFEPAKKLGIVASKNGSNYDVFRNRIIFPIHDINGNILGFGGRTLLSNDDAKQTDTPKYFNSQESTLFRKSEILYGLYFAARGIRERKYAILTEGYTDVISFHQCQCNNTVATCGTALTTQHAKLLKRYTDHVVLCRDADAAGLKATVKDVDTLLTQGLKVDVVELPKGEDPDSYARKFFKAEPEEIIEEHTEEISEEKVLVNI